VAIFLGRWLLFFGNRYWLLNGYISPSRGYFLAIFEDFHFNNRDSRVTAENTKIAIFCQQCTKKSPVLTKCLDFLNKNRCFYTFS